MAAGDRVWAKKLAREKKLVFFSVEIDERTAGRDGAAHFRSVGAMEFDRAKAIGRLVCAGPERWREELAKLAAELPKS